MSLENLLAHDAPLLSPTDYNYSPTQDSFPQYTPYNTYCDSSSTSSSADADSPIPAPRMLKFPANESLHCVPTHQLFDFPQVSPSPSEPPSPVHHPRLSISINPGPASALSAQPPASQQKNAPPASASAARTLFPQTARLVKNRAAAFLSRQRKREEFELMEVRVAELEQENARLLAMSTKTEPNDAPISDIEKLPNDALVSQIEQLRAQLHAAEERERELNAELTAKSASRDLPLVKIEPSEPSFPLSPAPRVQSPHKSAASLGLMVLLCALPSLLSMPSNSTLPTSFSLPHSSLPASSSAFDFNSFLPHDYDWSRTSNSVMDLDSDDKRRVMDTSATTTTRKLEFSDEESGALTGLAGLDISFDASPLDDGKIRVRIHHPSSSASSRAPSPGYATKQDSSPFTMFLGTQSEPSASLSSEPYVGVGYPSSSGSDPFLGVDDISSADYSESDLATTGGRRRVRIALKSMPVSGGEGGEWEVQFC
ncbi:hypothetical protein B0H14DRAFT_2832296 [Mycena olivaceomarginata]|nr:hypothetical protein B0H14DRAFT_2832296 [Mycena olivaceomarginata]